VIPLTWLSAVPRFAMHATIALLVGAIVYNAGAARQGEISLATISNANACMVLLGHAVEVGEQSAALHVSRSRAVSAFLRGTAGELVADNGGGR
jgi:hypothetical protein